MTIRLLQSPEELAAYGLWIKTHPQGNLWQSPEWKTYQETLGRETRLYAAMDDDGIIASALVVIDRTTGGFSTWDIPRGPLGAVSGERLAISHLMEAIVQNAKHDRCLSIYLSPTVSLPASRYPLAASQRHEQPDATRLIDLTLSHDDILKQMHQKGRYNIKVAEKSGVIVRESTDIDAYATLAKKTAGRDGFTAASTKTYRTFLETLPGSFLLLAYAGEAMSDERLAISNKEISSTSTRYPLPATRSPIAGLIGVTYGQTGVYYYGASDYEHRSLMAPYVLQWEAMKRCKSAGCTQYDLLGIAPPEKAMSDERLAVSNKEISSTSTRYPLPATRSSHPWAGISDFKAKFGGTVITYPPEQEIVLRPVMRGMLKMKRRILG